MQTRVDLKDRDGAVSPSPDHLGRDQAIVRPSRPGPTSRVVGVGAALPDRVLTNAELATFVDTSDEWIRGRTGIEARHIAAEGEFTSHLATRAATAALGSASLSVGDIDLLVVGTATPDHTFPSTAVVVQEMLGMSHGAAFDVGAACSGFVFAMSTADGLLAGGNFRRALVIGAETFSRILDWSDRTTCVLFGDGAGAIVLEAPSAGPAPPRDGTASALPRGILATAMRSDGAHRDKLYVDGGPSTTKTSGVVRMRGQEVFKFAVQATVDVVEDVFRKSGLTPDDIDWFVPHQANKRIINASARKLGIGPEKVVLTVAQHGNTSAASIPLALEVAVKDGRIKAGDLVLLEALGGGFTWAAMLVRWG